MKKKVRAAARGAANSRNSRLAPRKSVPSQPSPPDSAKTSTKAPGKVSDKTIIRRLYTKLAVARAQIELLQLVADTDFLLDIPNRRGFERELDRAIAYIKRYHASGALVVLDVDRLKPINDAFGHAAGDQVLKGIAATIMRQVRASDVVGRLGGDEFAVLLWNLSETDARAKAAALEQSIDQLTFIFDGRRVATGASAGVAILDAQAEAARMLERADSAMYVRKAQRRHERRAADG
ncbi:MAG: GGDEF domain-containing protein [Bradyrhizobium sp.]|uniref:GGDEF domain-containing protein n=1 Tax=Bradyrhizobium sp. TaxID=376 RepID=UPI001D480CC9|nr:GGDEF domain-containing protein [Bradyrhizobium sp.]MBV9565042.1 GGDEF domain-containing protein [Bradyrhizobium sp.]